MEVWQMDRVITSYVSVDVVVALHGLSAYVYIYITSCRMLASLTGLSIGADFHNVDHDDDLDTNPFAAIFCGRRAAGVR